MPNIYYTILSITNKESKPVEILQKFPGPDLKGNKGQNQNLTHVLIGKIQVTFIKYVLYPDKVILDISPFKVGIRSLGWDHRGHYPDKRS